MTAQNATEKMDLHLSHDLNETARYIFIVVGGIEVVCGVFGNLILLATLINRRSLRLRNVHNLFIANLALTDLVTMGYWFPVLVLDLILRSNPLSETHCRANGYLIATFVLVSSLSLTGISLNRYLNVCHPHLFTKIVTLRQTFICCILSWIISFIIVMPPLFGVGEYGYSHDLHVCSLKRSYKKNNTDNYNSLYQHDTDKNKLLYWVIIACTFLIMPMVFVGYWNFAIFRHWKSVHLKPHSRYPQRTTVKDTLFDSDMPPNANFKDSKKPQSDKSAVLSADDSSDDPSEYIPSDKCERLTHQALGQSDNETKRQQERKSPHSETQFELKKYSKSPQTRRVKRARSPANQGQPVSAHVQQLIRQAKKIRAREKAFVRSLFVVFLLMVFSFIPFVVITIVHSRIDILPEVNIISDLFLFLNSAVNWIVYGVMNHSFRRQYVSFVRHTCCRCFVRCDQRQVGRTKDSLSSMNASLSGQDRLDSSMSGQDRLDSSMVCEEKESVAMNQVETAIS